MKSVRILCALTASALAMSAFGLTAFAEDSREMTVTVRIEGIAGNLYYDTQSFAYDTDELTVQDVLTVIDEQNEDLTITGIDIGYISAVNDDKESTFGGWDGWLYTVNGVSPVVAVSDYVLSEGDSIVLYYGDPFGVGMQYPTADSSALSSGVLTFTSEDTIYDENYNATVVTNPVADMTVEWFYTINGETLSVTYTTDDNGQIVIDADYLTEGEHNLSVAKYSENGCPLILRLTPDYTVTVTETVQDSSELEAPVSKTEPSESSTETSRTQTTDEPNTGDNTTLALVGLGMVSALALAAAAAKALR